PSSLFSSTFRLPPTSTPFPYTTLFRSLAAREGPNHVGQQPVRGPVAAADDVAGARGREREGRSFFEERAAPRVDDQFRARLARRDRKSTRLNSSHVKISYAVFCLKKKI